MLRIKSASGFEIHAPNLEEIARDLETSLHARIGDVKGVRGATVTLKDDVITLVIEMDSKSWSEAEETVLSLVTAAVNDVHGLIASSEGNEPLASERIFNERGMALVSA
jgi:hypothetical protein